MSDEWYWSSKFITLETYQFQLLASNFNQNVLRQKLRSNTETEASNITVTSADSSNLDLDAMRTIKMAFPEEVKEKLKEANKERYNEMVGQHKL
ncbi:hypothetical protein CA3LBN_004619 [Candidozyma haemuli]|uniref:Uncharacterized protein n=1 Tax=Candidozyma haemuli TaxID=45357 RepID=A0ABX8IE54_9ASCO|nr:hypothetical protein CA3LBN_004619 [[Candida] haemuloni]